MKIKFTILATLVMAPILGFSQIKYGDTNTTQYHQFFRNGTGAAIYINQVSSDPSHQILRLSSGTGTPNQNVRFTVENDGSVGIGTTTPEARFHLSTTNVGIRSQHAVGIIEAGDAHFDLISSSSDTWGSSINLIEGNGNSNTDVWSMVRQTTNGTGNSSLRFNFGSSNNHINTNIVTFNSDGNVGIGYSDAAARLHIYKNATTGNWGNNTLTNAGIKIQDSGASLYIDGNTLYTDAVMNIGTINNNFLSLGTNNEERVRINANGSVGIGTGSTGSHKLAVEGSIGAREIKVEATGWSDFVFENEYELLTLEEVEEHINENGHLPEIPSEAYVTENGINLGEMDAKLLQKIEELTLYLIEQNKQNQSQQARIEQLEKELKALKNK